ncbi:MAG TPA: mycofactocin biosynthesis peptidyl-dipeptidase MftE [Ilumatobacteraceae bacterium]|nr:mycofactocin biosynthesis peptidyl-dipeptidase MftE [Ilumatobacteraceae bacterium]
MTVRLGDVTWTDLWNLAPRPIVAIPIGSCEQHGPHLPLDTDTRIAVALAEGLAASFDHGDVLVGPTLAATASGEHAGFPGTLSVGTEVLEQMIVELVRSAGWSAGVVLVNGHGGNARPVQRATNKLHGEGRRVLAWWPHIRNGDAHAGETETSMMLAIAPAVVRMTRAEAGRPEPLVDLIDELRENGVRAVSPNGVLGDPRRASANHGKALLTRLIIDLVAAVDEWRM